MSSIHEQLIQIKIKPQSPSDEAVNKVLEYAEAAKPKKLVLPNFKKLSYAFAAAAVMIIAAAIFMLPQTSKDLTYANISYYTVDINPSISIKTDASGTVISATGLNEDGKELLALIQCEQKPIDAAMELILTAAKEMGYLDGNDIVIGYFGDGTSGISMDKVEEFAGEGKTVLLAGTQSQYDEFLEGGLQPGLELLTIEGDKLGLDEGSSYSDIIAAIIKSEATPTEAPTDTPVPSDTDVPTSTPETSGETPEMTATPEPSATEEPTAVKTATPTPESTESYTSSTISGSSTDSGVSLSWTKITNSDFNGYKVVASKTNPNPQYPDDGYIYYYTDSSKTSTVVPLSKLEPDTYYYFSITVLYDGGNVAGNAIRLKTPASSTTTYEGTTLSGSATSTGVSLSWSKVTASGVSGYKVVASSTDSTPCYPDNGYIEYITNLSTTSRSYSTSSTLKEGVTYWFAITVLYSDGTKVTSNVVQITMPVTSTATPTVAPTATPSPTEEPEPGATATEAPTATPTEEPTTSPTEAPTATATEAPTATATEAPTATATEAPTATPTEAPTATATTEPT